MAESGSWKKITIHTNGGCDGNPRSGGWAALLRYGNHVRELTGGEPASVNPKPEARNPRQTENPQWCFGFVQDFGLPPSAVVLRRTGRISDLSPGTWLYSPKAALTPGKSE
jgi:hypothetical protein